MKSMTGYGNSHYEDETYEIDIEIKSLNNRFLDISLTTNSEISNLEPLIRKQIKEKIRRGKVYAVVNATGKIQPPLELDKELLSRLYDIYREAYQAVSVNKEPSVAEILKYEGVIVQKFQRYEDDDLTWKIQKTLAACLQQYGEMSREEGNKIKEWMEHSMNRLDDQLLSIEAHIPTYRENLKKRLKQSISEILTSPADKEIEKRLMAEVAFYMDRYDVNEEIVRLKDHIEKINDVLAKDEPETGKRMNFIIQEMQREIQTLSSKFNNVEVFSSILAIKEEIEKCRELIQNVE